MSNEVAQQITLSVAVTAHSEGGLLRPTLRSISAAISELASHSVRCELLIVLDNATAETTAEAERWLPLGRVPATVRIIKSKAGDASASRNAAAQNARGVYLAFCDGDDLITSNSLQIALGMLTEATSPLIVHPSEVVSFGARSAIWTIPDSESIDYLNLVRHNLWPSSSVSQRSTYLDWPYTQLHPESGFGPEDWLWNIETAIAGIPHRPAPETMFFYRVREFGGVNNRHTHSILPTFDLDGLVKALPIRYDPEPVVVPTSNQRARQVLRLGYRLIRPVARLVTTPLGQARREGIYDWVMRVSRVRNPSPSISPLIEGFLREAAEVEPALSWTAYRYADLAKWNHDDDGYAALLVELVENLKDHAEAIVTVPWVGIGGADLVSINYAKALVEDNRFHSKVSMLATYIPSRTIRRLVPEGVNFVQVPERFRELSPDQQRRLLAQVLLLLKPKIVVSVNCFDITNSLQFFGRQLGSITRIFLTLFAFDRIGAGYPVNPITDDSQRTFLREIGAILTDNSVTAGIVQEMLALDGENIRVHHQPALDPIPLLSSGTRSYNNRHFSDLNPFKLIWPHRLDKEKRPDSLIAIAERLRRESMPVNIHVYGQQVLSTDGEALMKSIAMAGIKYEGPYQGGLMSLPTHEYHALLLTSESEGLPLVLVQSMLLGLPVISTAVGGVTDIVRHNETGLLVSGPDDIDGFISSIRYLMHSLEDRRRIIDGAYEFAVAQHGWATFAHLVEELT